MDFVVHIDEVDDDDAAQIAQTQLTGNHLGCFEIGLEYGVIEITAAYKSAGIDIDGGQCLGLIDDHISTGLEGHAPR